MNFSEIIFNRGRVYLNPVNLTNNFGTELCYLESGVNFMPGLSFVPVSREEDGAEIWKMIYIQSRPMLSFTSQNYNTDVLRLMFPKSVSSLKAGSPGNLKSGHILSDDTAVTCRLLFLPDEPTNKPCLIVQKAVPIPLNNVNIRFSHKDKMNFTISCYMLRASESSDYGLWYYGLLANGVLL